jgi:arylsulfatase A-like enzyme
MNTGTAFRGKQIALLLVVSLISSVHLAAARPNIIVLLTDDQNYASLGCTGNDQVKTPNLDRLGEQGLIFDAAYDTTSICMASRAQVMTGMYEYKTGCNFSHGPLSPDKWRKSYPVVLREAGYHTGFVGKFGFAVKPSEEGSNYHHNEDLPIDSFDVWLGWAGQGNYRTAENEFVKSYAGKYPHVTRALGAASRDFIREAKKKSQPFCLSVSFKAPHGPMSPDPNLDGVYADTSWRQSPNFGAPGAAHLPEQAKSGRQYRKIRDFTAGSYQSTMRKYQQLIHGIDHATGMIRAELEAQGLADNTVILFLTDNGYNCGSHDFGGKVMPYEEGSRSPMIVYDPRHPVSGRGKRCRAVVGNIDVAPTVLALAGLASPENMDGKSLLPLLDNPASGLRASLLLMNVWGDAPTHALTVVTEDYKYIHWPYAQGMEPREELYHLARDRYEMKNVSETSEHRDALGRLRKFHDEALATWKTECVDTGGYGQYTAIFDRSLSWEAKLAAMETRTRRIFTEWKTTSQPDKKAQSNKKTNPKKAARAAARAKKLVEREKEKAEKAKKSTSRKSKQRE